MPSLDISFLNCFYFFLLMSGVLYAIFVMIAGGLHSIHLPVFDIDLGHLHIPHVGAGHVDIGTGGHEVSLLSLSPIAIATFITSFGGIGLIATLGFRVGDVPSVVWAVIGSTVVAIASHFAFFYFFIAPQASSALQAGDMIGHIAEVITPIPATSVGEVAYVAMGERHTATARTADGTAIPRGSTVTIERIAGTLLIVKLKQEG